MIYIYKYNVNKCPFTLMEKTTLSGATYFIDFYSKQNKDSKLMWLHTSADTSTNTARYNLFEITESNTDDVDNLQINLEPGQYDYTVYQTTGTTLALSAVTNADIVEYGRANVMWPDAHYNIDTFDNPSTEITFE